MQQDNLENKQNNVRKTSNNSLQQTQNIKKDTIDKTTNKQNLTQNTKQNKIKLKTIIGITCTLIFLAQIILVNVFNVTFEIKVVVEVASIALTFLVYIGVIKKEDSQNEDGQNEDGESLTKTKNNIKKQIQQELDNLKNNKD